MTSYKKASVATLIDNRMGSLDCVGAEAGVQGGTGSRSLDCVGLGSGIQNQPLSSDFRLLDTGTTP